MKVANDRTGYVGLLQELVLPLQEIMLFVLMWQSKKLKI